MDLEEIKQQYQALSEIDGSDFSRDDNYWECSKYKVASKIRTIGSLGVFIVDLVETLTKRNEELERQLREFKRSVDYHFQDLDQYF